VFTQPAPVAAKVPSLHATPKANIAGDAKLTPDVILALVV
jgi:hypothetical protein